MPLDLSILDEKQRAAVFDIHGSVLIYAGAGAGKTRVVASRVAYLIERGVSPSNILCFTFTNKAADEMRERIENYTDGNCEGMWIGTFHKICARLLQIHGKRAMIQPHFAIYDENRSAALVKLVMKDTGWDKEKWLTKADFRQEISRFKREMKNMPDFMAELKKVRGETYAGVFKQVFTGYQSELRRAGALDFDDLIMCTVRLLQEYEDLRREISGRFHYVHVDEYQDTAEIEAELVSLLSSEHRNLCVVGDPNQAIYRFKGANFKIILDFPNKYHGASVHVLDTNYRSARAIVDASSTLISNNVVRPDYRCEAKKTETGKVEVFLLNNDGGEAYFVADSAKYLIEEEGFSYGDIAVLCRTNMLCLPIERALVQAGVPYQKTSGSGFYSKEEIQCAVDFLHLVVNPRDEAAALYLLTKLGQGVGVGAVDKVRASARANGTTILEVCAGKRLPRISGPAWTALQELTALIANLIEKSGTEATLTDLVYDIVKRVREKYTEEVRIQNLEDLLELTAEYSGPAYETLQPFLESIALYDVKEAPKEDMLQLMTIHQAKGLEFPVVFVPGVEEDILPHFLSLREGDEAVEEERRLCYVAITRAIECCYLSNVRERRVNRDLRWPTPSRFLEEVKVA